MDKDPDALQDAESDDPWDVVKNLNDKQLDEAWNVEARSWMEMGLDPRININVDVFLIKNRVDAVVEFLIEANIVTRERFDDHVKRRMLAHMIRLRREHQSDLIRAKIMEGVNNPIPPDLKGGL